MIYRLIFLRFCGENWAFLWYMPVPSAPFRRQETSNFGRKYKERIEHLMRNIACVEICNTYYLWNIKYLRWNILLCSDVCWFIMLSSLASKIKDGWPWPEMQIFTQGSVSRKISPYAIFRYILVHFFKWDISPWYIWPWLNEVICKISAQYVKAHRR